MLSLVLLISPMFVWCLDFKLQFGIDFNSDGAAAEMCGALILPLQETEDGMVACEVVQELQKAAQVVQSEDFVMSDKSLEKTPCYNYKSRTSRR